MNTQSLQLTGGNTKKDRRELDFYPTPSNVTVSLMNFLQSKGILTTHSLIAEPACGNGMMSKVLESYGHTVISSDIRETGFGTPNIDFLNDHYTQKFDAIITNPPFNLSEQFIVKSLELAPIVAMVLKSQYWHSKKRFKLFEQHTPAYVLPLTWRPDFLNKEKGGAPTMEVLWTVWIKGDTLTKYQPILK